MNGKDQTLNASMPTAEELRAQLSDTALAFRGYNITNLGRTYDFLTHPVYGNAVERDLRNASRICAEITGRPCDLVATALQRQEFALESYAEAIALIMSVSLTQLHLLEQHFGIPYAGARLTFGYSLGEITGLVASGMLSLEEAMAIPLTLANDCVALAWDVTLGVLFSRGTALPLSVVHQICVEVNSIGQGVIGVSAILSPNSILLMGQGDTLDRFYDKIRQRLSERIGLRKNAHRWPPLHTPIVWQRQIADRAAVKMHTMQISQATPHPPVLSLVTGSMSYDEYTIRDVLRRWVYEPQQLWVAVYETLTMGMERIIHVGPEPNIIPATYKRLSENIMAEKRRSLGMKALSAVMNRRWLRAFLPERVALLHAPLVQHVNLEDWLLAQHFGEANARSRT